MYRLFERAVAVLVLLFSMQVFRGQFYTDMTENNPSIGTTELRPGSVIAQAIIYLLFIMVAAPRLARVLGALGKMRLLTALFLLAVASILWSIDPVLTFRRIIPLCAWLIIGVYFGERYSIDEFLEVLAWTFGIVITLTFVSYFIHPSFVRDPTHSTAWRGFFVHKNNQGAYMVLSALVFATRAGKKLRFVNYAFCAASVLLVFLSHSATALVLGVVVLCSTPLWRLVKLPMALLAPLGACCVLGLSELTVFLSQPPALLLSLLGRDPTLSGRKQLWSAVVVAISRRPLLGYGYDAFWQGLKGESLEAAVSAGWLAPHSHNGYLDLTLGLGTLGLVLFGLIFISLIASALRYARRVPGATACWPIAFATFFAVHNVSESALLTRNELPCLLFVTMFAALRLEEYRNKRGSRPVTANVALPWEPAHLHDYSQSALMQTRR